MVTVQDIQAAHGKVKSGADFPAYIQDLKAFGITHYEAYVADGHIDYHVGNQYTVTVPAKYAPITIAKEVQTETFKTELLAHQQGKTDYLTFIHMCASTGIEKWEISMELMTCTYFDLKGEEILMEKIPG